MKDQLLGTEKKLTYKKKYRPQDSPAPVTLGVTPRYNPFHPSACTIHLNACMTPL